jgi:tryptophan-rich sensory protein
MIEPYWRYSVPASIIWTVIYFIVLISGLIGNSVVASVIIKTKKCATDYFLLNLVVADLFVLVFCLPATLISNLITRKFSK